MDNTYKINFDSDLTPAFAALGGALRQRQADKRSEEYLQMEREAMARSAERESAALARQKAEEDRKHAIEAWNAMPMLQRAAAKSVGMANMNPYGVHFDEQQAPGQSIKDVDIMGAKGGQYGDYARARLGQSSDPLTAPHPTLEPGQEGPEENPESEARRFEPAEEAMEGPSAPSGIEQAQAILAQPRQKQLFATYQGQRFEVPQVGGERTPFGPKYDEMVNYFIDNGDSPKDAHARVVAIYKADQTQNAIADRTAQQIEARRGMQNERQDFQRSENEKYRETHQGRMELVDEAGKFKVAAAAPGLKADAANARDMSVLRQQGAAIRSTGQYSKLAASDKTVRGIFTNIASGSVPLQHADAQIQLARFFRQAQPTEGEMHMLYNNLGGTADKWNQFIAKLSKGDLSPEQMRQLKASAAAVKKEHHEDLQRFVKLSQTMLGPGSGFDNMPDQAEALYRGMATELGIENPPPLYQTEGGVTLGSGQRPSVQAKGTKRTQLDELESYLDSLGGGGGR